MSFEFGDLMGQNSEHSRISATAAFQKGIQDIKVEDP
jgi:hypothetical protein